MQENASRRDATWYTYACTYSRDYALTRTRINMYMYTRIISVVARGQRRERRKKTGPCTLYPFLLLARMYVPYRCARETLSPGVDARCALYPHLQVAAGRGTVVPLRARKREEIAVELRPLHLRVPVRERCGRKGREPKGERRGKRKREGKTERESTRGIYIGPRISSETMRSVTPRATPRQTVVLPRFLFPLSVLACGDPSLFRPRASLFLPPAPSLLLLLLLPLILSVASFPSVTHHARFFFPFFTSKRDGERERALFARYLHKLCRY